MHTIFQNKCISISKSLTTYTLDLETCGVYLVPLLSRPEEEKVNKENGFLGDDLRFVLFWVFVIRGMNLHAVYRF